VKKNCLEENLKLRRAIFLLLIPEPAWGVLRGCVSLAQNSSVRNMLPFFPQQLLRVLVRSGSCNKTPRTAWSINSESYSSRLWRLRSPSSRHWQIWYLEKPALWVTDDIFVSVSPYGWRGERVFWGSLDEGTNPIPPSWPNHLPKALPPNAIASRTKFQYMHFE
jgi:hypothetical protein